MLTLATPSYQALKRILERHHVATEPSVAVTLVQSGGAIRAIDDYQAFFEQHAQSAALGSGSRA